MNLCFPCWILDLANQKWVPRYGMYSQLRMMVTQDHHGDEGQPYPSFGSTMRVSRSA